MFGMKQYEIKKLRGENARLKEEVQKWKDYFLFANFLHEEDDLKDGTYEMKKMKEKIELNDCCLVVENGKIYTEEEYNDLIEVRLLCNKEDFGEGNEENKEEEPKTQTTDTLKERIKTTHSSDFGDDLSSTTIMGFGE